MSSECLHKHQAWQLARRAVASENIVARDGIEPSTFRFSVGGSSVSDYHHDPVCNVFMSKSLHYDSVCTGI